MSAPRTSGGSSTSLYQVRKIFIFFLRGYKLLISPLLPSACRFHPTCSQYMREAIEVHGAGRGVWMGIKRLGRCHPFHEGGCDPVPGFSEVAHNGRAPQPVRSSDAAHNGRAPRPVR